ncbi:hypothetical protein [Kocuria sp. PD6]|uniref:hypothetical protein n=1 Tax=Kocuria sp. PD6 TaxID=2962590 RepID=UPI00288162D2|nr:hypothetical protein [Kocuria sp. PD6]MDT0120715.1 hypothetical protein [Kocuria sp. PD6]
MQRLRKIIVTGLLSLSWLSGLALAITVSFAGYIGMGALALVALARLAVRRVVPREIAAHRRFPGIVLWLTLDAVSLIGAAIVGFLGLGIIAAAAVTPPWWAALPGILALTAGILALIPPIRSITTNTRRSRASAPA